MLHGARFTLGVTRAQDSTMLRLMNASLMKTWGKRIGHVIGVARLSVIRLPSWLSFIGAVFNEFWVHLTGRTHIFTRDKWREATAGDWTCRADRLKSLGWAPQSVLVNRLEETARTYVR